MNSFDKIWCLYKLKKWQKTLDITDVKYQGLHIMQEPFNKDAVLRTCKIHTLLVDAYQSVFRK